MTPSEGTAAEIDKLKHDIRLCKVPASVTVWMSHLTRILEEINENCHELELKVKVYEDSFEDIEHQFESLGEDERRLTGELSSLSNEFLHLESKVGNLEDDIDRLERNDK